MFRKAGEGAYRLIVLDIFVLIGLEVVVPRSCGLLLGWMEGDEV